MTVSVILPTFNRARLLREAVGSVLAQTHTDLELIVVDDGSTDETPSVLGELAEPRLKVIRQENLGKSAARNRGLDAATGEFVGFLDSDDLWSHSFLESVLRVFESESELDFVFSNLVRFDESGLSGQSQFDIVPKLRGIPSRASKGRTGRVILGSPFSTLVPLTQFVTWLQCVVIRRNLVEGIRFPPDLPLGQDYAFMLQVYAASRSCGYVDEPHAFLRRHKGNSYFMPASGVQSPHALPTLRALLAIDQGRLGEPEKSALLLRTGIQLRSIGRFHFWNRDPLRAAPYFWRALRYPGSRLKATAYLLALPYSPVARRWEPTEEHGD